MDDLADYLPKLLTFRPLLYGILLWSIFVYAFRRGGWEERTVILASVLATYLTVLFTVSFRIRYTKIELPIVLIDLGVFLLLQGIALKSAKFWPLWLAAFEGVVLLSHMAPLMPGVVPRTYYDATALWSYPKLIVLAFGIANHHRAAVQAASAKTGKGGQATGAKPPLYGRLPVLSALPRPRRHRGWSRPSG